MAVTMRVAAMRNILCWLQFDLSAFDLSAFVERQISLEDCRQFPERITILIYSAVTNWDMMLIGKVRHSSFYFVDFRNCSIDIVGKIIFC